MSAAQFRVTVHLVTSREKQIFCEQLAQLLRAGQALPKAAERLSRTSSAATRKLSRRLVGLLEKGLTAGEAFDAMRPELGPLERSTLSALARTGRLEFGLQKLADYFGVLARTRLEMWGRSAYPLFVLHVGIFLLNVPSALGEKGGLSVYLVNVMYAFALLYGAGLLLALLVPFVLELGARSTSLDRLLRSLPFFGGARRALATARFIGTLDLQLDAGINVMESVAAAAEAGRSGLLSALGRRAVKGLRKGEALTDALNHVPDALPGEALDAIQLAEETGELHRVLPELRAQYEEEGARRLRRAAKWIPQILYLIIVGYLGWKIVQFWSGYFAALDGLI